MEFEWDEAKAVANLGKHGIAFRDARRIFSAPVLETRSDRFGEERWKAIGEIGGEVIAVVYAPRQGRRRLISARKANTNERKAYGEVVDRGR